LSRHRDKENQFESSKTLQKHTYEYNLKTVRWPRTQKKITYYSVSRNGRVCVYICRSILKVIRKGENNDIVVGKPLKNSVQIHIMQRFFIWKSISQTNTNVCTIFNCIPAYFSESVSKYI